MKKILLIVLGFACGLVLTSCSQAEIPIPVDTPDALIGGVTVPVNCSSWYDGCNTCFVEDGQIGGCTRKYCEIKQEPRCLQYEKTADDSVSTIVVEDEVMTISVGSQYRDCVGAVPMKCLVVDGENFYEQIQGFNYQEGNEYRLKVLKSPKFLRVDEDQIPQDAGMYEYKLLEVLGDSEENQEPQSDVEVQDEIEPFEVPKNCSLWYDGCNDCSVVDGKISACTERACFQQDTPKCIEFTD